MKYSTGELAVFWLLLAGLCVILPTPVIGRALESDNFIPEDDEYSPDEKDEADLENYTISEDDLYNIVQIVKLYLADKDRRSAPLSPSRRYSTGTSWNRPIDPLRNGFGGYPGKRSTLYDAIANNYARNAVKRSSKNALKRYFNPVDTAGGSLFGHGIVSGTGR